MPPKNSSEYPEALTTLTAVASADIENVVEELYGPLYRFALSLTGGGTDAYDLTQEAFYRWFKNREAVRDPARAKSWLFTTLYREYLRGAQRARKHPQTDLESAEFELPSIPVAEVDSMDAHLVMQALQAVDEVYRACLSLFYLENYSYQEIAALLGIPVGTVMSRLSRGRDHLRRELRGLLSAEDLKIIQLPRQS